MIDPNKIIGNVLGNRKLKIDTRSRNKKPSVFEWDSLPGGADIWHAETNKADLYISHLDNSTVEQLAYPGPDNPVQRIQRIRKNKGKYILQVLSKNEKRLEEHFGTEKKIFALGTLLYAKYGGK